MDFRFQPFWHRYGEGAVVAVRPHQLALLDAVGASLLEARDNVALSGKLALPEGPGNLGSVEILQARRDVEALLQPVDLPSLMPTPVPHPEVALSRPATWLTLSLFSTRLRFGIADSLGGDVVRALWPPAEAVAHDGGADITVDILPTAAGWLVVVDGASAGHARDAAELKSLLVRETLCAVHGTRDWLMVLHAAAVMAGDRLLVLPGRSGSGKTTLAATLVAQGMALFSDDCVPLRLVDGTVRACASPGSLGIRPAAAAALEAATLAPLGGLSEDPRHHTWPGRVTARREAAVAWLVFPVHEAGHPGALEPLDHASRLAWLLDSGSGIETLTPAGLAALLDWLALTPAWVLRYGQGATALGYIERLLNTDR